MDADGKPRVLVIEDSKLMQLSYRTVLGRAGYEVNVAASGFEALQMAMQQRPDVIILDMMLPNLPGLDVLRLLKHSPQLKDIPVVVISALPPANQQKLQGEGAARFLFKDEMNEGNLLSALTEAMAIQRKQETEARLLLR